MTSKSFVLKYLSEELRIIQTSERKSVLPELNQYEKTLIFHYSDSGFEQVNERLRDSEGKELNEFGILLKQTLKKLPDYSGLVYRNVNLDKRQILKYQDALKNNNSIAEPAFSSCSYSKLIANEYGGNVTFRILSKTGKNIEAIAKHGLFGSPNEKEVIFLPNTEFIVLAIEDKINYLEITLEEC